MILFCPSIADHHGDHPHRLVYARTTSIKGRKPNERRVPLIDGPFTICAACDHWTKRAVYGCRCPWACHSVIS